ncbi:MAG: hypothetical protein M1838_005717 [Thelocarpon superellum]|nr:MAG: hypothetical protein M1838_005717 [Thelocarpon superellum]
MLSGRPQYFQNKLRPVAVDKAGLVKALEELRAAIRHGLQLLEAEYPAPNQADRQAFGTIFNGSLGVGLTFLRLEYQSDSLDDERQSLGQDLRGQARKYMNPHAMELTLQLGRPSPLQSAALGATVLRILAARLADTSVSEGDRSRVDPADLESLREALQVAIHQEDTVTRHDHAMGGDEMLYGRAGLLWALLNLRNSSYDNETETVLRPILADVPKLVDAIVDAGSRGAAKHVQRYGGILTILLACNEEELNGPSGGDRLHLIGRTISSLCELSIAQHGHLETSTPVLPSSRASPLVQLCHGTPGLLLLLATARSHPLMRPRWAPVWDEAISAGSQRVWEEGLLSKGGGLCHGMAGNAWPWLMLHDSFAYGPPPEAVDPVILNLTSWSREGEEGAGQPGDVHLSRALAFLLHARDTPPFAAWSSDNRSKLDGENQYRTPDHPYSLFEGLAGTTCAWAEACVTIEARLCKMRGEGSAKEDEILRRRLGMPGLGGHGARGML